MLLEFFKLTEAKYAKPNIYWHGTSSTFLKSILSQGLLPVPSKRTYPDHRKAMSDRPSMKTHGGVYMTDTIYDAMGSSRITYYDFGGSPVIIKIQAIEQSSIMDEDLFYKRIGEIISVTAFKVTMNGKNYKMSHNKVERSRDEEKIWSGFKKILQINNQILNRMIEQIHDLFGTKKHIHTQAISDYIFTYIDRILVHHHESLKKHSDKNPNNIHDVEEKFIQVSNRLINLYRRIKYRGIDDVDDEVSIRITRPVKYKGHTKIVGIMRMNYTKSKATGILTKTSKKPIEIVYGSFTSQEIQYILDALEDQFGHLLRGEIEG